MEFSSNAKLGQLCIRVQRAAHREITRSGNQESWRKFCEYLRRVDRRHHWVFGISRTEISQLRSTRRTRNRNTCFTKWEGNVCSIPTEAAGRGTVDPDCTRGR